MDAESEPESMAALLAYDFLLFDLEDGLAGA